MQSVSEHGVRLVTYRPEVGKRVGRHLVVAVTLKDPPGGLYGLPITVKDSRAVSRVGLANHPNATVTGEILEDARSLVVGTIVDDDHQEIDPEAAKYLMPGSHNGGNAGRLVMNGHDQGKIVLRAS